MRNTTKDQLCGCGDIDKAYEEALAIFRMMQAADKCTLWAGQVASALHMIAAIAGGAALGADVSMLGRKESEVPVNDQILLAGAMLEFENLRKRVEGAPSTNGNDLAERIGIEIMLIRKENTDRKAAAKKGG